MEWVTGLVAHGFAGVGAVDIFVAARRPAGTVLHPSAVIFTAGYDRAVTDGTWDTRRDESGRVLKVAAQTKVVIAGNQHLLIHRTVGIMANRAAFDHGVMLKKERPFLCRMALRTSLVRCFEIGATPGNYIPLMRVMAVIAGHLTS